MLIGIPPLLGPEFLATLRGMGHGDELAIVDGNYPAVDHARRLVRADGHGLLSVIEAVLTVMPLDQAVPAALFRASLNNDPVRPHGPADGRRAPCGRGALSAHQGSACHRGNQ